jgi:RecA/RadA recombinase
MTQKIERIFHYKISTGSNQLDLILDGGFIVGSVVAIAGGSSSGKSAIARSFAINALKIKEENGQNVDLKVLHIGLEAFSSDGYMKGLSEGSFGLNDSKEQQQLVLKNIQDRFGSKLLFKSNINKIDDLYLEVLKIHNNFRFNIVVLDYPQLFLNEFIDEQTGMDYIMEQVKKIAVSFDCVVFCPVNIRTKAINPSVDTSKLLTNKNFDIIMMSSSFNKNGEIFLNINKIYNTYPNHKVYLKPNFHTMNWIE